MFDRVYAKSFAKARLKENHFLVVLIVLLTGLLGGTLNTAGGAEIDLNTGSSGLQTSVGSDVIDELLFFLLPMLLLVFLATLALVIFVGNVMTVGGHGWLLRYWRGEKPSVGELFAGFRIYKPALLTMLLTQVYTFLWSLLFLIPGIVKGYAYSMVPYIIYENPNLSADEAITLSCRLTDGSKGELFVLDLSWIGWVLLSTVTAGIVGILYVNPYMALTHAGVYEELKWRAIQSGRLTWADFGQMPPVTPEPPADPAY